MTNKTNSAAILGRPLKKEVSITRPTDCVICFKPIPAARVEALVSMKTDPSRWTHVGCSTTTKIKGIYMGEVGTSEIKLCDKIYSDSVRSVFKKAEVEEPGTIDEGE